MNLKNQLHTKASNEEEALNKKKKSLLLETLHKN